MFSAVMRAELNTKCIDFQLCIWGHPISILKSTECPSNTMYTHILQSPLIIKFFKTKLFRLVLTTADAVSQPLQLFLIE